MRSVTLKPPLIAPLKGPPKAVPFFGKRDPLEHPHGRRWVEWLLSTCVLERL